jgi:small redox-active disulfide protein 2
MKKLQILGVGCASCARLADNVEAAAQQLGIEYEVEKVMDIDRIIEFGAMMTPALAVDGEVKLAGKVPSVDELKELLA